MDIAKLDMRTKLSTIWLFVLLNYLYCDILGIIDPVLLNQYITGTVSGMQITQGFLLGAAILMEIPISMVLFSRLLAYRANRLANIIAGTIMTLVQVATLFLGTGPTIYYLFFSIIEIAGTSLIVWYAFKWTGTE